MMMLCILLCLHQTLLAQKEEGICLLAMTQREEAFLHSTMLSPTWAGGCEQESETADSDNE